MKNMTHFKRALGTFLIGVGFDPRKTLAALRAFPYYVNNLSTLKRQWRFENATEIFRLVPTLSDLYSASGTAKGHYFHQDLWAAREIFRRKPLRHLDVGSRIDGFIAHLLCFRDVEVIDIRKLESKVRGLSFKQADMMQGHTDSSLKADSVSCLHALEHFGLGRYGDPIDLNGWKKGIANIASIAQPGAVVYLSVPIGRPAIEFNAQRIFSPEHFTNEAALNELTLESFSLVDDLGDFQEGVSFEAADGVIFGCGCFVFKKHQNNA